MAERTLGEQIRQAYKKGSSGGTDDWHPTVRNKYEDRMADNIKKVLSESDLTDERNLDELSHLLAQMYVAKAENEWDIVHSPGFIND